jgi:hypothetical protein
LGSALEAQAEAGFNGGRVAELLAPTAGSSIRPAPYSGDVAGRALSGGTMTSNRHPDLFSHWALRASGWLEDAKSKTSIPTRSPEFDFADEYLGTRLSGDSAIVLRLGADRKTNVFRHTLVLTGFQCGLVEVETRSAKCSD